MLNGTERRPALTSSYIASRSSAWLGLAYSFAPVQRDPWFS